MALTIEVIECANPLSCDDNECLQCDDLREARIYNRNEGMRKRRVMGYAQTNAGLRLEVHDLKVKLAEVTKWCDHYRGRASELVLDRDVLLEQRDCFQARIELAEGLAQAIRMFITPPRIDDEYPITDHLLIPVECWDKASAALAAWRAEEGE